jgi:serine/threonine protein kinase
MVSPRGGAGGGFPLLEPEPDPGPSVGASFSERFIVETGGHPNTNSSSRVLYVVERATYGHFVAKVLELRKGSQREIDVHEKCTMSGHPNILPLWEVFHEVLTPGHIMRPERTNHGQQGLQPVHVSVLLTERKTCTLRCHLRRHLSSLTHFRLDEIRSDIVSAVLHVHACGYVHGDLKPDNFVVDEATGRVCLIDFGCARRIGDTMHIAPGKDPPGTMQYLPPEVLKAAASTGVIRVSTATDIWAVGAILFEALTGQMLFPYGDSQKLLQAQNDPTYWSSVSKTIGDVTSGPMRAVLCQHLAWEPAARFLAAPAARFLAAPAAPMAVEQFATATFSLFAPAPAAAKRDDGQS